jgi:hypothetical protein
MSRIHLTALLVTAMGVGAFFGSVATGHATPRSSGFVDDSMHYMIYNLDTPNGLATAQSEAKAVSRNGWRIVGASIGMMIIEKPPFR